MSLRQLPLPRTRRCARGAVSVMAALLIATVAIAALVSIDVGHVFMRQRQLQNMVDLAAMSAAQQLKRADSPTMATPDQTQLNNAVLGTVANISAKNGYPSGSALGCGEATGGKADAMTACLGMWDPTANAAPRYFSANYAPEKESPNAVRVQATQTVPILFVLPGGAGRQLYAEAVASGSPPVASFTLGSGVLTADTAKSLLAPLLGNALAASIDWNGLLNTTVTVDQLRLQAKAGTVQGLLGTTMALGDFYALVLDAAGRNRVLDAWLQGVPATLGISAAAATVKLNQLLDLDLLAPTGSSAAQVGLNVAHLILAGAQVASANAALSATVPIPALPLGLGGATASLKVISPPVTAVGPARQLSDGSWQTSAHTSQVSLKVSAEVNVGALAPLANIKLTLPLHISVGKARANLKALQCAARPEDRLAILEVKPSVLTVCLTDQCTASKVSIGQASALTIPLLDLVVVDDPQTRSIGQEVKDIALAPGGHKPLQSDTPLTGILTQVLALKVAPEVVGVQVLPTMDFSAILLPVIAPLDTLLTSLLLSLGIQLGTADLWLHSIDCNNSELVY
ncbi:TadG family pilus assembly protein [Cupriavidus alkaliphilus]|uniref:TadG family pilus assembly protein n=1 Tax=Cupriavidus alkaliphilus TaxID=942866 RepID=UPI00184E7E0A|nr:TadG family pilus assembly protein [Cupriavidus alkaliphilus]MBB3016274.1 putative membrane protein [Cupriavidus alkaliphilus]